MIFDSRDCPSLDSMPRPACFVNEDGSIYCTNAAFRLFFGVDCCKSTELANITDVVMWSDPGMLSRAILDSNHSALHSFRDASGTDRFVQVNSAVMSDESAKPRRLCIFTDPERNRRLAQSVSMVLPAMDQIQESILITDRTGIIVYVNAAFELQSGWKAEETIGRFPTFLKSGEHKDSFYRDLWRRILAGEVFRGEMKNRRRDGTIYSVEKIVTPIFDETGKITYFISTDRNITEELQLRNEKERSDRLFRMAMESFPHQAFVYDRNLNLVYENLHDTAGLNPGRSVLVQKAEEALETGQKAGTEVEVPGSDAGLYNEIPGIYQVEFIPGRPDGMPEMVFGYAHNITESRLTERRLSESEKKFRTIFENSALGIAILDRHGRVSEANPEFLRMLDFTIDELRWKHLKDITLAEDFPPNERFLYQAREGQIPGYELRKRYVRKDGTAFWARTVVSVIRDETDQHLMTVGIVEDISDRVRAEAMLARTFKELEDLRTAVERVSLFAMMDNDGLIIRVNQAFSDFFGTPASDLLGRPIYELSRDRDAKRTYRRALSRFRRTEVFRDEIKLTSTNEQVRWFDATLIPLQNDDNNVRGAALIMFDVTDRKKAEEALIHQALHDSLTDLPNRNLFTDRLRHAMLRADRLDEKVAVLFIDLDRFKFVNDTFGHAQGDVVLVEAAGRIQRALRTDDTVCRQGGDEFMVLLSGLRQSEHAAVAAQKILSAFQVPISLGNVEVSIGASIGIALFPDDARDSPDLLRFADMALYRAKEEGRGRFGYYNAAQHRQSRDRFDIEWQIRKAIKDWSFVPFFQPRVNVRSKRIVGVETLIRWNHPERGILTPEVFIPIAEEAGIIYTLGEGIFRDAVDCFSQWKHRIPAEFIVSVNLSARQFYQTGLLESFCEVVNRVGLSSRNFELEITESTLMNLDQKTLSVLHGFRNEGFRIALDDFGTGYSSLTYLERLPVDTIKIDRSFITGLPDSKRKQHLVQAMVMISRGLGLSIVAEGVEKRDELDLLIEMGCDEIQGFFFGRPLPAADVFPSIEIPAVF